MAETFESADALKAAVGRSLGPSEWLRVEQERVNLFADATDDHQWIHVDVERAKQGPFGAPIAQDFAKATDESGWRAGLGVVWMLGNPGGEKAAGCGSAGCASPGGCDEGCTNPASTTGCGSCGEGPTAGSTECDGCGGPAVDAPASPGCASCAGEPAPKGSGCVDCAAPSPPSPCACEG